MFGPANLSVCSLTAEPVLTKFWHLADITGTNLDYFYFKKYFFLNSTQPKSRAIACLKIMLVIYAIRFRSIKQRQPFYQSPSKTTLAVE